MLKIVFTKIAVLPQNTLDTGEITSEDGLGSERVNVEWPLLPFISANVDTLINKSLKSTLMVLPNNAKKTL